VWCKRLIDTALLLNILAAIGGIGGLGVVIGVAHWLGKKFAEVDGGFRLINEKLGSLDKRVSLLEERVGSLENRVNTLEADVRKLGEKIDTMDRKFISLFTDLVHSIKHSTEFLIEVLSYESIVRKEAAEPTKSEIRRIYSSLEYRYSHKVNPFMKQDLERMKYLIEKEELTYEEAEELRQLAEKACKEYCHEIPEIWKIYWYAVAWKGIALRLQRERSEKKSA
jgi:chromosome segregation ATPase